MQTKENLSQAVKDVKVEIVKDVFKKENTANARRISPNNLIASDFTHTPWDGT